MTTGVWQSPTAIKPDNRSRSSVGIDFVLTGNQKTNLHIFTGATVSKIDLAESTNASDATATGVQFISGGQNQTIKLTSRGNVVVSAGTSGYARQSLLVTA